MLLLFSLSHITKVMVHLWSCGRVLVLQSRGRGFKSHPRLLYATNSHITQLICCLTGETVSSLADADVFFLDVRRQKISRGVEHVVRSTGD